MRQKITKELRYRVFYKYNEHCAYCGCKLSFKTMQIDHLESYMNNGENLDFNNLMPSCRQCNFYKNTLTLEKFREQLTHITDRLNKTFIYRLAKKYNLIIENANNPIVFYFEKYKNEVEDEH